MLHVPHVHVPHVPHPDLRQLARDVTIATEVVVASVVLTGSATFAGDRAPTAPAVAAPDAVVVTTDAPSPALPVVRIDLTRADGVIADVHVPATGELGVFVLDAAGTVVATVDPARGGTTAVPVAAGTYRLLVRQEGPVEQVGEVAISAASVLRSDPLTIGEGETLTVRLLPAG